MKNVFFCLLISAIVVLAGCSRGRPTGFPNVRPCSISVTDGGSPIADVEVQLVPETSIASTIFSGTTDATGKAVISTVFAGHAENGVPEGSYTVVLKKDQPIPHTKSEEERVAMSYDQAMKYAKEMEIAQNKLPKIIPVSMTQNNSPLKLTVEATGGTLDIDVSQQN